MALTLVACVVTVYLAGRILIDLVTRIEKLEKQVKELQERSAK